MPVDTQKIYQDKIDSYKLEAEYIRKRLGWYSLIRLFLFVLSIFLLAVLLKTNILLAIFTSLLALALLMFVVRLGAKLSARRKILTELIRINVEEIGALNWEYDGFHSGPEYFDPDHPNSSDLDIFGENSLFQYLNRTSLSKGRDRLAVLLSQPSQPDEILTRHEAIEELSTKIDWRQLFLANGRMSGETKEDYMQLRYWLNEKPYLENSRFYRVILIVLPILTILSLILTLRWIPYNIPIFFVLIQLGIVGMNLRQINHHHNQVSRKYNLFSNFSKLIGLIESQEFKSVSLMEQKAGLSSSGIGAGLQLKKLAKLVIQFDRRLNMVMAAVLNGILMWDLLCILWLEKWKTANASEVPGWFDVLGNFEAMNSLANFRYNNPKYIYPRISENETMIEAEALGHPLIPGKENVLNNLKISQTGEFMLITGSNMAGKSTYLRTAGVNLVLANAGAPVLAAKMIWKPALILTSMRVKDSLSSRESTFYAELKRLRMIIEVLKSGEKLMIILDEILKGTNSRDKHFGSEMFIRQLLKEDCAGIIATHDLELSKLEEEFPGRLLNYSFEVQIENEEFIFDYKLRRGACQTLNATELMKKMGISIDEKS